MHDRQPQMHERSRTIDTLFTLATHLPHSLWDVLLDQATGDTEIRAAVRARLEAHASPADSPTGAAEPVPTTGHGWEERLQDAFRVGWVGRHIGSYEITGVLGQGGMGTVYRARRADGQFEHDVAVKVVRHDLESPAALERLRLERQILARLTHPAIARLIDGGTVGDGVGGETPYFVMELVEGAPITSYCEERSLPLRERLRLFRAACEGVIHAHQQLVVHRDLKPSNILITPGGQPKLLDFGIAKLLEDQAGGRLAQTSTGMHLLTPEYASPEQVRGEPVTAMADVYSLGTILYELLTGVKAHRFQTRSPEEISRVICMIEATRPSTAVGQAEPHAAPRSRQLKGDLDTIVLKALRKDPARRYGSVEQLSEDVGRYLEGLPVRARPDTVGYRTSKFLQRNRVAVAAGTVVLVTLIGAVIATSREARARAIEADRAQRQLQQIRTFASTLLVDLHDAVAEVPGATAARSLIVSTAQRYLAGVATETSDDPTLRVELAESYRKFGDVQFDERRASLGNAAAALDSYRRALALLEPLTVPPEQRAEHQRALAETYARIAAALSTSNDRPAALETARKSLRAAEAAVRLAPDDARASLSLVGAYGALGRALMSARELPAARDAFTRALDAATKTAERQSGALMTETLARAHENVAEVLSQMGQLGEAVDHARRMVALLQTLATAHATESTHRRQLVAAYSDLGDLLGSPVEFSLGQTAEAETEYRKALAMADALAAADPRDAQAQLTVASLSRKLGNVVAQRDPRAGVELHRRAIDTVGRLLATAPQNVTWQRQQALNHLWLGHAQLSLGQHQAALDSVRHALDSQMAILAKDPARQTVRQDLVASYNARGDVQLEMGDDRGALQSYTAALDVAETVFAAARLDEWARRDRIDCYERMGTYWARRAARPGLTASARTDGWQRAREWHEKSLAEWAAWRTSHSNVYIERRHDRAAGAVAAAVSALEGTSAPTEAPDLHPEPRR